MLMDPVEATLEVFVIDIQCVSYEKKALDDPVLIPAVIIVCELDLIDSD
jgi:hypothetical protein